MTPKPPIAKRHAKSMPVKPSGKDETHSYEMRKINNGFIVKHNHQSHAGFKTEETFHPHQPVLNINPPEPSAPPASLASPVQTPPAAAKPKRAPRTAAHRMSKISKAPMGIMG